VAVTHCWRGSTGPVGGHGVTWGAAVFILPCVPFACAKTPTCSHTHIALWGAPWECRAPSLPPSSSRVRLHLSNGDELPSGFPAYGSAFGLWAHGPTGFAANAISDSGAPGAEETAPAVESRPADVVAAPAQPAHPPPDAQEPVAPPAAGARPRSRAPLGPAGPTRDTSTRRRLRRALSKIPRPPCSTGITGDPPQLPSRWTSCTTPLRASPRATALAVTLRSAVNADGGTTRTTRVSDGAPSFHTAEHQIGLQIEAPSSRVRPPAMPDDFQWAISPPRRSRAPVSPHFTLTDARSFPVGRGRKPLRRCSRRASYTLCGQRPFFMPASIISSGSRARSTLGAAQVRLSHQFPHDPRRC